MILKAIRLDTYLSIVLLVAGALVFMEAKSFPQTPGEFPVWISTILIGLSALLFIQSVTNRHDDKKLDINNKVLIQIGITAVAIGTYIILLPYLGYIIASFILVLSLSILFGYRSIKYLAMTPLAAVLLCWVVFLFILNIPLPGFAE